MKTNFSKIIQSAARRRDSIIVATLGTAGGTAVLIWASHPAKHIGKLNDFQREAAPAYTALAHGHVLEFLRIGPAYVGSLVLRAPFALIPAVLGGSTRAVYFASALPCILALAVFCAWLGDQPRKGGRVTWGSRISPLACCIINPLVIVALFGGHPEEILGAVLCVAAVTLATKGRAGWAGFLIALAVINKPWALVAVPLVVVLLPAARVKAIAIVGAVCSAVLLPVLALHSGGIASAGVTVGVQTGTIFNPPQLLWWLGPHSWIVGHARIGLVALTAAATALWLQRARGSMRAPDVLLFLAFLLLLRAALDPWNNLYYHIPFLFALMAYEIRRGRMPLVAVVYTFVLLTIVPIEGVPHMSPDLRAAVYLGVILPTLAWLAWRSYWPMGSQQVSRTSAASRVLTSAASGHGAGRLGEVAGSSSL